MQSRGRYELLRCLGRGGMAECFLARFTGPHGFEREVVVKRVLPHLATQERFIKRIIEEARLAARLHHPHIAQVFELGDDNGTPFLALEHVDGKDLFDIVALLRARKERMAAPLALRVVQSVLEALAYAHAVTDDRGQALGLVHRDVSTTNVLISYDGEVKLIDFGIARTASREQLTQPGVVVGKTMYMAPEHMLGYAVDGRADVYACGVMLHELLTCAPPLPRDEGSTALRVHEDIPRAVRAVINAALEGNVEDRPSAAELAARMAKLESATPADLASFMRTLFSAELASRKAGEQHEVTKTSTALARAPVITSIESAHVSLIEAVTDDTRITRLVRVDGSSEPTSPVFRPTTSSISDALSKTSSESISASLSLDTTLVHMSFTTTAARARPRRLYPVVAGAAAGVVLLALAFAARTFAATETLERGDVAAEAAPGRVPERAPVVIEPVTIAPLAAQKPAADAPATRVVLASVSVDDVAGVESSAVGAKSAAPLLHRSRTARASKPVKLARTESSTRFEAPVFAAAPSAADVDDDGALQLRTEPRARAFVDGRDVGRTPLSIDASPGRHEVDFVTDDGEHHAMPVFVRSGKTTPLTTRL